MAGPTPPERAVHPQRNPQPDPRTYSPAQVQEQLVKTCDYFLRVFQAHRKMIVAVRVGEITLVVARGAQAEAVEDFVTRTGIARVDQGPAR